MSAHMFDDNNNEDKFLFTSSARETNDYQIENLNESFKSVDEISNVEGDEGWQKVSKKIQKPKSEQNVFTNDLITLKTQIPSINNNYNQENINIVIDLINRNVKCMIILRGCSGSGKSTLANQIKFNGVIVSADNYFINSNGVYAYDPSKIADAHAACKSKVNDALKKGISPIIVDNTHLKVWEFKPYVTMAVKNTYHVEIMEPRTPWRYKASELTNKNCHNVSYNKIKKALIDFDKNINMKLLIEQCKNEINLKSPTTTTTTTTTTTAPPKKSSNFLTNMNDFFSKSDWSIPEFKNLESDAVKNSSEIVKVEESVAQKNYDAIKVELIPVQNLISESLEEKTKINESKDLLKALFPDIKEAILVDFLVKYHNDVDMVTNILLDSVNLGEFSSNSPNNLQIERREERENLEKAVVTNKTPPDRLVPSLKDLCVKALNSLEDFLETRFKNDETSSESSGDSSKDLKRARKQKQIFANDFIEQKTKFDLRNKQQVYEDSEQRFQSFKNYLQNERENTIKREMNKPSVYNKTQFYKNGFQKNGFYRNNLSKSCEFATNGSLDNKEARRINEKKSNETDAVKNMEESLDEDLNEEPILSINLNKEFLSCLVQLFGDSSDECYLNDYQDIEVGFKLGYKLYKSWKKTTLHTIANGTVKKSSQNLEQIENDKQLSLQLFDQINTRNPIEHVPVFFSEQGVNSAATSLRQIMAEEMAEQMRQEKSSKKVQFSLSGANEINNKTDALSSSSTQDMASLVKIQHLYEKYENLVDKKMINEIFRNHNNNFDESCNFIDTFYEISESKEPTVLFNIKDSSDLKNKLNKSSNLSDLNSIDFYTYNEQLMDLNELSEFCASDYRNLAEKYLNLRQDYFEKASEAYNRGWGLVAQYYAEMGHTQSVNMHNSNNLASIQTFLSNNPDIRNSNTLDLHGLSVKEALNVLKKVIYEKRLQLNSAMGKKTKTFIFVVTGYGRHSENAPRLRPNVISYLNQSGIKFKEPHVGLLQVDLLNI